MAIGVCFINVITWSLEYCSHKCYLFCLVLVFSLFWMDILCLKNWVVGNCSNLAMIRRVI